MRTLTAAGDWRWTELTVFNSLADPDVGGLILNLRDVTAELESERALRESEARYRAIVETTREGIVLVDADGRINLANERIADILGLPPAEVPTSGRVHALLAAASQEGPQGDVAGRRCATRAPTAPRRHWRSPPPSCRPRATGARPW